MRRIRESKVSRIRLIALRRRFLQQPDDFCNKRDF